MYGGDLIRLNQDVQLCVVSIVMKVNVNVFNDVAQRERRGAVS